MTAQDAVFSSRVPVVHLATVIVCALASELGQAGGVVTNTDEVSLDQALQGGGVVTIAVDGIIPITTPKRIQINTVIDATGHQVSLRGAATNRLIEVSSNTSLFLVGLTLNGGSVVGQAGVNGSAGDPGTSGQSGAGGAVYVNRGANLHAVSTVFATNAVTGGDAGHGGAGRVGSQPGGDGGHAGRAQGGAIFNDGGEVYLTSCAFLGNIVKGGDGGSGGDGNNGLNGGDGGEGGDGGGASGGAIYSTGGFVGLVSCELSGNGAGGGIGGAGGLGDGTLGFDGSNGSAGEATGGALFSSGGRIECVNCTFDRDSVNGAHGWDGKPAPREDPGENGRGGASGRGGAVAVASGSAALTNCTFFANAANGGNGGAGGKGGTSGFGGEGGDGGDGGEASGGALCNLGSTNLLLVSCTFAANSATGGPGGAGGAPGTGVADSGGSGSAGPSLGGGIANSGGTVTLKNALLADSASSANASGRFIDGGHNLSSDPSPVFTEVTSVHVTNAYLGAFGAHGGPTPTIQLLPASPAIDRGDSVVAPFTDQRLYARSGAAADIGAYEFNGLPPLPILHIQRQPTSAVLNWSAGLTGYRLQSAPSLSASNWTTWSNEVQWGSAWMARSPIDRPGQFFRIVK
jgi:hypothetical protein